MKKEIEFYIESYVLSCVEHTDCGSFLIVQDLNGDEALPIFRNKELAQMEALEFKNKNGKNPVPIYVKMVQIEP